MSIPDKAVEAARKRWHEGHCGVDFPCVPADHCAGDAAEMLMRSALEAAEPYLTGGIGFEYQAAERWRDGTVHHYGSVFGDDEYPDGVARVQALDSCWDMARHPESPQILLMRRPLAAWEIDQEVES